MNEKKFHSITVIWKNTILLKNIMFTIVSILCIIYVSFLMMLVDAEDVIIFNIFLILIVLFNILKGVVIKSVYNNKLYLTSLYYVNFFLQEKIIFSLYAQILKNKLVLNSVEQISSNWLDYSLDEIKFLSTYNKALIDYLNILYLNNLLNQLNQEFIEKVEKLVDEAFFLIQLNYYSEYLSNIGVLEDGTSKQFFAEIEDSNTEIDTYDFDDLK
jgi:hypothetical protein